MRKYSKYDQLEYNSVVACYTVLMFYQVTGALQVTTVQKVVGLKKRVMQATFNHLMVPKMSRGVYCVQQECSVTQAASMRLRMTANKVKSINKRQPASIANIILSQ